MKAPTAKLANLPTTQELSQIAAQILPLHSSAEAAATAALALWEQCAKAIETRLDAAKREKAEAEQLDQLRQEVASAIDSAPAMTFPELLRRLMPDARNDEREKRFRTYLAHATRQPGEQAAEAGAEMCRGGELLAEYRKASFSGLQANGIEHAFKEWWDKHLSQVRSESRQGGIGADRG